MSAFFSKNEQGTTLTEFVMCVPMLLLCFFGIIRLSEFARDLPAVEAMGFQSAVEQTLDAQESSLVGAVVGSDMHASPTFGALDAYRQVRKYPPRQKGAPKHFLEVVEMSTYSFGGLTQTGHMGESYSRAKIPRVLGAKMAGVENTATMTLRPLVGTSATALQLLNDAPGQRYDHDRQTAGEEPYLQKVLSILNQGLDASGGRASFGAGIRYGTETGHYSQIVGVGPASFAQESYYTFTVAPYTSSTGNDGVSGLDGQFLDSMRAIGVIRVSMATHPHYTEILGFNGLENSREGNGGASVQQRIGFIEGSHLVGSTQVNSPNLEEMQLLWPLNYDSGLVGGQ